MRMLFLREYKEGACRLLQWGMPGETGRL